MPTYSGSLAVAPITAYASASDVAAFCRNLLSACATFSTSTSPTLTDVNGWLGSGYSVINTYLGSVGYSVPVSATTTVYPWLTELNALFGAAKAEMSRANVVLGPGE